MKGPGIQVYLMEIEKRKQDALTNGLEYLDITSKNLHGDLSKEQLTVPTCCQAMYQKLLKGDQILQLPKGKTGFGSHLTVRYYLHDLDTREVMMERKQRGRPRKYDTETERPSFRKSWKTENLIEILSEWVEDQEATIDKTDEDMIYATKKDGTKWIIEVHGAKRGRKSTLIHKFNHLFTEYEEDNIHYSLVLNDMESYRRQWEAIPNKVKNKLNLSIIVAGKKGLLEEL